MDTQNTNTAAVFFISTGRCGTQFFASKLARHFSELARVEHEPVQQHYRPRHYFSAHCRGEKAELDQALQKHFESIDETLNCMHYVETGWPAYGLLPSIVERFKGRVKVVHLFRHPVKVAASLSTHDVYGRNEWTESMSIMPSDDGVRQSHLAGDAWAGMSEFSKCLFWWTEINSFALNFRQQTPDLPWLSLRFEDVFSPSGDHCLKKLVDFIGLPQKEEFLMSSREKVDRFSLATNKKIDIDEIEKFDVTMRLMGELGYTLSESMASDIKSRYNQNRS